MTTTRTAGAVLAGITLTLTLTACGGSDSTDTAATSAPTKTTTAAAPAATSPVNLADCRRADEAQVSLVAAALNPGLTLGPAFSEDSPAGDTYIGANIMRGTERISSADVWVFHNGSPFSLSSDARSRSSIIDGRKLRLSAGDPAGSKVQDCVVAQLRKDNGK
ncbi:hypothetical protein [Tsukamurella sp. 1534]|uniref:hypothetical protein n=1 Tax=Tsukamurella sp. 1534 TaxID=1151061 RepID=UPI0003087F4A|nr:hypothetical protein [Tsukamurella sp. 1534]